MGKDHKKPLFGPDASGPQISSSAWEGSWSSSPSSSPSAGRPWWSWDGWNLVVAPAGGRPADPPVRSWRASDGSLLANWLLGGTIAVPRGSGEAQEDWGVGGRWTGRWPTGRFWDGRPTWTDFYSLFRLDRSDPVRTVGERSLFILFVWDRSCSPVHPHSVHTSPVRPPSLSPHPTGRSAPVNPYA